MGNFDPSKKDDLDGVKVAWLLPVGKHATSQFEGEPAGRN